MARRSRLSVAEARRIAFAAQGFDRPRPHHKADARHFRRLINELALLQLDYVNVLLPAQLMVVWSRLGAYDRDRFHNHIYHSGEYTEHWAHEASLIPQTLWPLLEYRRKEFRMHPRNPLRTIRSRNRYLAEVLQHVERNGMVTASDVPQLPGPARKPGDWQRSAARCALEYHFGRGNLAVVNRQGNFQRRYDLPERVIHEDHRNTSLSRQEAWHELVRRSVVALGVADTSDVADYFRMTARDVLPVLESLSESGVIQRANVDGWEREAWLDSSATCPARIEGASLLSPFDPMVWYRPRAERLFGFHYRIEIYVPASKRKYGYYVLPFRIGDNVVARVDLKADRKSSQLCVLGTFTEEGVDRESTAEPLATELRDLAAWLGLDDVKVAAKGNLARALRSAMRN